MIYIYIYIDLLRNILIIMNLIMLLSTVFDDYYINRNDRIYCIDNLYKKYDISRYNFLKKKYGVVKKI